MSEMPDFEYYDGLNYFLSNYYLYLTLFCQGFGYLFSVLYHFTSYKYWNIFGTMIALLCLPVDIGTYSFSGYVYVRKCEF